MVWSFYFVDKMRISSKEFNVLREKEFEKIRIINSTINTNMAIAIMH